ncbi:hypothetical protein CAEBREN_08014 [Caenorhabditis brenneri]|uniref:Uncharacterized protein n=1 Tax=Caenorhabditis brenneri TaxID=135651 RepID=G0P0G8_CAEBE|nr:hypothetical protein CAEBREN_08014 [Caenorhabditis brenneri]
MNLIQLSNQQIYPNNYTSNGNFAFQNNLNMLNPNALYPVFHNPYAHTTFVQNHIYQPQTNQGGFYNLTQPASTPYAQGIEIPNWKSPFMPGAAQPFAPSKSRNSDPKMFAEQEIGGRLHPKIGFFQNGNSKKQKPTATMSKQANKYRCSSCKQITEKVILKKKGPNNWLCVRCYNRCYNFTGYQKYLFDKMVRNAPAS